MTSPLILGSSLGTSSAMWDGNAPMLERRLRLVRYDHRGYGTAPTPPPPWELDDLGADVLALMDRLRISRASIGGISLGAMVAMWLAIHAPERVDKLVLCCTTARFGDPRPWRERQAKVLDAGSTEPIADSVVERWLTPPFAAEHPEVRERLRTMLVETSADGYAAACGAIERMDLSTDLSRIAAPTLVISAAGDPATPPEHQRAIADAIRGARLETVRDAAHLANVERPHEVSRLILDHLETP